MENQIEATEATEVTEANIEATEPDLTVGAEQALTYYRAGDVDGPNVQVRSAWRDLSCKGSGPEAFRRVILPGRTVDEWASDERLPSPGFRAADRRATVYTELPIGSIVITFSRSVYHNQRGKCSVAIGLLGRKADGSAVIWPLKHRTLRSRPVYEVELPDGSKLDIAKREK